MTQLEDDRRRLNRSINERVAYVIDGLAQGVSGTNRAAREINNLLRTDGEDIERLKLDINSICQQLEIVLVSARRMLK